MSRAFIDRLRAARQATTGHKLGTIKTTWHPRPGAAASPDPTSAQAAVEAMLLHVSYGIGARTHPLGYVGVTSLRMYTHGCVTPHADQLVIGATAPNNWIESLIGWDDRGGVLESGGARLVVGFDEVTWTGWILGPEGTAIVLASMRYGRRGRTGALEKRTPPSWLVELAADNPPVVREHPTDRMLSALVRRFRIIEQYLTGHHFFSFDGHLGIKLRNARASDKLPSEDSDGGLGFTTGGELVQACLTDPFLGVSDVVVDATTDEWVAIEDQRSGGRLLLRWSRL